MYISLNNNNIIVLVLTFVATGNAVLISKLYVYISLNNNIIVLVLTFAATGKAVYK